MPTLEIVTVCRMLMLHKGAGVELSSILLQPLCITLGILYSYFKKGIDRASVEWRMAISEFIARLKGTVVMLLGCYLAQRYESPINHFVQ